MSNDLDIFSKFFLENFSEWFFEIKRRKIMQTTKTILALLSEKNISAHKFEMECGLANGSVKAWKNGQANPSQKSLQKIAKYFGVSIEYLYGFIKDPDNVYDAGAIVSFDEIGSVAAGYDSLAVESLTGKKIDIPVSMLGGRPKSDYFILRVKGNSMYPRLLEGDDILCLRCDSVDSGDYAVVLYNGDEATVKQVRYVYGEDWLELIPANPEYAPKRIVGADLQQCKVLGKVIKLIRDF